MKPPRLKSTPANSHSPACLGLCFVAPLGALRIPPCLTSTFMCPNPTRMFALGFITALVLSVPLLSAAEFEWQKSSPENQGESESKLDALKHEMAKRKTKALVVARNDHVVCEWYAPGTSAATKQ